MVCDVNPVACARVDTGLQILDMADLLKTEVDKEN